jgi:hypothetical protein
VKTVWTKGVTTPQGKSEIKQEYLKAAPLRGRLKELLEDKITSNRNTSRSNNTYDSPSWALLQADSIGYERALFEVISLIYDEKVQKEENKE